MDRKARRSLATLVPVESARQIRALRSTVRQDIVDVVQAMGSASVPELAQQLGRPADALYYHVRALKTADLLVEAGSRIRGRHSEVLYSTCQPDGRLMLRYRSGRPDATKPLRDLVGSMLRAARREFDRAITDPACSTEGPRRELWPGRIVGWLTPSELGRVNEHLAALTSLLSSPRIDAHSRLYALHFLLSPSVSVLDTGARRTARATRKR